MPGVDGPLVRGPRAFDIPLLPVDIAEVGQGLARAKLVAGLQLDRQRLLEAGDGILKPPQILVGVTEVGQCLALAEPVGAFPEDR